MINRSLALGLLLAAAVFAPPLMATMDAPLGNRLEGHASPYLAMHARDPVHWQSWGSGALQRARRENKLLFLSIGYFACHWCHVMQRESYQNESIAAILNQRFVPVKVDRELRPALDEVMIRFVQRTRGSAGWPLNVFLTPEGYPLFGLTYAQPETFRDLVSQLAERWKTDHERLAGVAARAVTGWQPPEAPPARYANSVPIEALRKTFVRQALRIADDISGGFGNQNKFPSVPQLLTLLNVQQVSPSEDLHGFLALTLQQMANQGLRDHLGGGFFRYTVDPTWQTPHFEKMLYDNALLVELYLTAGDVLGHSDYLQVAEDTARFMSRVLENGAGTMIASLSAVDDKGVEGGYYLWSPEQLAGALRADERRALELHWNLTGTPHLEAGFLPIVAADREEVANVLGLQPAQVDELVASARARLMDARGARTIPRDTKILAAWNGLALAALARLARQSSDPAHHTNATRLRDMLLEQLWDGTTLLRARATDGDPLVDARLEDYAYVARGLLEYALLSNSDEDMTQAAQVAHQGWTRFYSDAGWRLAEQMLLPLNVAEPVLPDGPTPSPSAVLIDVSLRIAARREDTALRDKALQALRLRSEELDRVPYAYASHINALIRHAKRLPVITKGSSS